ncbi:SIS domain-containing protein [Antarcticirhabdus aurantiaca]|uniref:SIS domain-containing protein n=1 Tax=Antarcticirhabdus aurantiaca TaxID=2606717 RepID=A0ACD4NHK6_9HYPH|nr:SIS domain-containing protein [Antarcticirhabdus aurantiaca]WAJ26294.1 SIS domain-containing protein [Jeongeuplla avenae]
MTEHSLMRREIDEIPAAVHRFLDGSAEAVEAVGRRLAELAPAVTVTVARGSSDHAATYFKYASEIVTGRPVASLGPSVVSVYGTKLRLAGQAALAISQSGKSPDIVALLAAAREGGAETIAIGNVEGSPLLQAAHWQLPLRAGPERSVAATKSFVTSVVAALAVLAAWSGDEGLKAALAALPDRLAGALGLDWSPALGTAARATSLYALGRGPGFAVASEAALKLKETSVLHAEAYSGAEVLHGPVSLVEEGFPVLAFVPDDAARPGLAEICSRVSASGAALFTVGEAGVGTRLPHAPTGHPLTEPLSMLVSFYRFVEEVARIRGQDPDVPRGLKKVTETL